MEDVVVVVVVVISDSWRVTDGWMGDGGAAL